MTGQIHSVPQPPALRLVHFLAWITAILAIAGCGVPNATAQPAPTAQASESAPGSLEIAQLRHEITALNNRVVQLETRMAQLEQSATAGQIVPTATPATTVEDTPTVVAADAAIAIPAQSTLALVPTATPPPLAQSPPPAESIPAEPVTAESAATSTATVAWDVAAPYLGQRAAVCGPVVAAQFAQQTNGQPTFLNLGKAFPAPDRFQIVIWGNQRANFPTPPEVAYANVAICVTGTVESYRGTLEITVHHPDQIRITSP